MHYSIKVNIKQSVVFCFSLLLALTSFAKREPAWMKAMPLPGNTTYIYVRESGEGTSAEEAQNMALVHVFQNTASRLGVAFDAQRALLSLQNGTSYEILSAQYNIPIHIEDTYENKLSSDHYLVTVLCQVIASRSVAPIWDKGRAGTTLDNRTYVVRSMLLPGLGQMGKGYKFGGTVTLLGEMALIGGAVGLNVMANQQLGVMDNCQSSHDINGYLAAQDTYYSYRQYSYYAWGAAGLLYVWNIVRAATLEPKTERSIAFLPSLMVSPGAVVPAIGLTLNF